MTDAQIIANARVLVLREMVNTARKKRVTVRHIARRLKLAVAEAMA